MGVRVVLCHETSAPCVSRKRKQKHGFRSPRSYFRSCVFLGQTHNPVQKLKRPKMTNMTLEPAGRCTRKNIDVLQVPPTLAAKQALSQQLQTRRNDSKTLNARKRDPRMGSTVTFPTKSLIANNDQMSSPHISDRNV